jgi:hypothetical protein
MVDLLANGIIRAKAMDRSGQRLRQPLPRRETRNDRFMEVHEEPPAMDVSEDTCS